MTEQTSIAKIDLPADRRLKITEVFYSLQGEAVSVGCPTVFIRLTGCPLRCQYCDTEYAFHGGHWRGIDDLVHETLSYQAQYVCVTGGEPLAQKNCLGLLVALCDAGLRVSLETSGAYDISTVDPRVIRVMDIKTPASGESKRNRFENIAHLRPSDQIKFVICSEDDYGWARKLTDEHGLTEICEVLFSPSFQELDAKQLAEWILRDRLRVRFQHQLHKLIWGEEPGH